MVDNSRLKSEKPFVSRYLRLKRRTFEEARRDRETAEIGGTTPGSRACPASRA